MAIKASTNVRFRPPYQYEGQFWKGTIHTNFSIFHCGWCCNGHKWWALHDQRHLKCVGTRPEGPCPLHNFVPRIDHIHIEICTNCFRQPLFFSCLRQALIRCDIKTSTWSIGHLPSSKKFRLRRPGWGWPLLAKNSCYRGRMNCLIWHKKNMTLLRKESRQKFTWQIFKIAFYWGRVYGFGKYHRGKVYDSLEEYSPLR